MPSSKEIENEIARLAKEEGIGNGSAEYYEKVIRSWGEKGKILKENLKKIEESK